MTLQVARNDTRRLAQAKDAEREREIAATAALKPGEAGYRLHARMPPQAKLDFVVNPKVGRVPEAAVRCCITFLWW